MGEHLKHTQEAIKMPCDTEELVAKTNGIIEECSLHPGSRVCDTVSLHHEVEHSDFGPTFKLHESHDIFRLSDIQVNIDKITDYLVKETASLEPGDEERQTAEKALKLLQERVSVIRGAIKAYIRTLVKFFLIKKQEHRMHSEDYKDKMEDIDLRRRKNHNALIESLTVYSDTVKGLVDYGFFEDFTLVEWDYGTDIEEVDENESKVVVFSDKLLSDRDLVRDWALSEHLHEMIMKIEELQKNDTR